MEGIDTQGQQRPKVRRQRGRTQDEAQEGFVKPERARVPKPGKNEDEDDDDF